VAGKYSCHAVAQHNGSSAGEDLYVSIRKNGTLDSNAGINFLDAPAGSVNYQLPVTRTFDMNGSTDYLSVWVYRSVNTDIAGDASYTYFEGSMLL
jgi:hypothetical protein